MERKDLLKANAAIFKEQGKALNDYAARDVKVLFLFNISLFPHTLSLVPLSLFLSVALFLSILIALFYVY
jgi:hypothetical protein